MKCAKCASEMTFLGTVNTDGHGDMKPEALRFDECEKHGIVLNRALKPRTYEAA